MIAAVPLHNRAEEKRLLARDDAICDALRTVFMGLGLSAEAESAIWTAARQKIEPILHLADDAAVAGLEAEATDRRLSAHAQTCAECSEGRSCQRFRVTRLRRNRLQDKADRALRALLEGRRR